MAMMDYINGITSFLSSMKSFRHALVFNGSDYSATDVTPDAKTSHSDRRRDRFKDKAKDIKRRRFDEKEGYLEIEFDGEPVTIQDVEHKTPSDKYIEKLRGMRFGRFIAPAVNFVFSPTFAKALAVGASIGLLFTPLGPAVGAAGLALTLGSIAKDVVDQVREYRKLNDIREERVLLNDLKKARDEINELKKNAPGINFAGIEGKYFPNTANVLFQGARQQYEDVKQSKIRAVGSTALSSAATMTYSVATAALTLSPVPLALSCLSVVAGYSSSAKTEYEYKKRVVELRNVNNRLKDEVGVDITRKNGESNVDIAAQLKSMREYREALRAASKDGWMTNEKLSESIEKEKALNVGVSEYHKPSFWQDFKTLIKSGIKWTSANRLSTPSLVDSDVKFAHSEEAYTLHRNAAVSLYELGHHRSKTQTIEHTLSPTHDVARGTEGKSFAASVGHHNIDPTSVVSTKGGGRSVS